MSEAAKTAACEQIAALERATYRWGPLLPSFYARRLTPYSKTHWYRLIEKGVFDVHVLAGDQFVAVSSLGEYLKGD